jgi:tetratricopeptide (TPR) repeat protein
MPKLGRWKKNGIETVIAAEAHSKKADAPEEQKDTYQDICYFANPEYHMKDYNKNSKWQTLLAKAAGLFNRKKREDAKEEAIDTAKNYYARGNHLARSFQLIKAIEDYTKAVENDAMHFGAFCERGVMNYRLGNLEGAVKDLTRVLEINPLSIRASSYRGNARMKTGNYHGAVEDYTTVIEFCDNPHPDYYLKRARAYRAMGEYDKSMQDFKKADELQTEISSIDALKSEYKKK